MFDGEVVGSARRRWRASDAADRGPMRRRSGTRESADVRAAGLSTVGHTEEPIGAPVAPRVGLAEAVAEVEAALDRLAAVDLDGEPGGELLAASVAQQRAANRLAASQLAVLGAADRRAACQADGAVTTASWYRTRTRLDVGECTRRVTAAARLPRLPALGAAFAVGDVTLGHVMAITRAAVPTRFAAVAAVEEPLVLLARHAPPRDLRVALQRVADHADRDGADTPPFDPAAPDPRRELHVRPGIDGLGDLFGTLPQLDTEGLLTLLDALETRDPPDTPMSQRRSAAQRRADAFGELVRRALQHGLTPTVHGVKPHVLLAIDLDTLLTDGDDGGGGGPELDLSDLLDAAGIDPALLAAAGLDPDTLNPTTGPADHAGLADGRGLARADRAGQDERPVDGEAAAPPAWPRRLRTPRLRWTGPVDPSIARNLVREAAITAVMTMGPWRAVALGRTMRTLPAWLRPLLDLVHQRCRGPDCDRPIPWTESHHQHAWTDLGDTDVNQTIPLCKKHRAPRGAVEPSGDERAPPAASRRRPLKLRQPDPGHEGKGGKQP